MCFVLLALVVCAAALAQLIIFRKVLIVCIYTFKVLVERVVGASNVLLNL